MVCFVCIGVFCLCGRHGVICLCIGVILLCGHDMFCFVWTRHVFCVDTTCFLYGKHFYVFVFISLACFGGEVLAFGQWEGHTLPWTKLASATC